MAILITRSSSQGVALGWHCSAPSGRLSRSATPKLIKGATDLLADVLNKPPALTFVVIQEVEMEEWGVDGLPVAEHRSQAAARSPG
ncbi:MAG: 4-oxalocrotonate tautomerase family protein [Isosphaeraceae bacterium]